MTEQMPKSFKPEVYVGGRWASNQLCFATKAEAEANAADLMRRWTLVEDFRTIESEEPVNHSWRNNKLAPVRAP